MRRPRALLVTGLVSIAAWSGCRDSSGVDGPSPSPVVAAPDSDAADPTAYENIRPGDYVGPEVCRECHAEEYQQWKSHPHSRMNQNATPDTVVGDFSGAAVEYGGITTVFEREGDTFFMTHRISGRGLQGLVLRRDRITRTIGSKEQQAYVGVQIEGPESKDHSLYDTERALPFVYWFSRQAWFPEHYVEQYPEPEYDAQGELRYPTSDPHSRGTRPWSEGCLLCHNTYPYAFRLARDFPGTGFSGVSTKAGSSGLPGPGPTPQDLVTLGISCESCHFGGREHVEHEREVRNYPSSAVLSSSVTERGGRAVTSICAQCHVAGTLPYPNGASSVNSSEALDMLRGDCASQISCADCHDPHTGHIGPVASGPHAPPRRAARTAALSACLGCHPQYESEPARRSHARHGADDASCLDCHMTPITQGIDKVVRSHRIDSPSNPQMLAAGAPNGCNLCHLDRSMAWTLARLRDDWGSKIEASAGWREHYGDAFERPVGEVWLSHETPVHRLVAANAYAAGPDGRGALPKLLEILMDAYPQNRMFGLFAIERIIGRRLSPSEYTPTEPPDVRRRQLRRLARSL